MAENQSFGWLKLSIKGQGGSTTPPAVVGGIGSCDDPAELVGGLCRDFDAVLLRHESSSLSSPSSTADIVIIDDDASPPTTTTTTSHADRLDDLTARLDRIKALLYEERSGVTASTSVGRRPGGWTPSIARGVFEAFTATSTAAVGGMRGESTTSSDIDVPSPPYTLLPRMVNNLPLLPFEARKSVSAIFNYLLVCGLDGTDASQFVGVSTSFAAYVLGCADSIIGRLVRAHDCDDDATSRVGGGRGGDGGGGGGGGGGSRVDIALLCGSMLRSSLRHATIYRWMMSDGNCERLVYPFLDCHVHNPNFDVSSDALETVRVMFTGNFHANGPSSGMGMGDVASGEGYRHVMEGIASDFLNRKYVDVIDDRVNGRCLTSDANYMTRRMTLQLLSSILLNRANYNVMMTYISSSRNLVTILCLIRDPSPHITLDAFQVFKIFVANPNKVSRFLFFA
jgi:calcium binding protein 39